MVPCPVWRVGAQFHAVGGGGGDIPGFEQVIRKPLLDRHAVSKRLIHDLHGHRAIRLTFRHYGLPQGNLGSL